MSRLFKGKIITMTRLHYHHLSIFKLFVYNPQSDSRILAYLYDVLITSCYSDLFQVVVLLFSIFIPPLPPHTCLPLSADDDDECRHNENVSEYLKITHYLLDFLCAHYCVMNSHSPSSSICVECEWSWKWENTWIAK
jgi:hypothetical protein